MMTLDKKHRYNLRKDIEFIESYNPQVQVVEKPEIEELEQVAKLSIDRFTAKEEDSNFLDPKRAQAFAENLKYSGDYKVRFLKLIIQNRVVASDMVLTYKNVYTVPRGGCDANRFPGIGNYMVYLNFKDALANGFTEVDCLQTDDGGYKHRLFDPRPLSKYEAH
jgi:hypothetical protein